MRELWNRIKGWSEANAEHATVEFFPEPDREPLPAYGGYLRLWLSEGFLAAKSSLGNHHFPVLHGGVSLRFLGAQPTPFTTFRRPPGSWAAPGAQFDFAITDLLPFNGGTVEFEAALYRASIAGPLATAVELTGGLAALMGPPLSVAAAITERVSSGLDAILAASQDRPVLGVHWTMIAPGGGGNPVHPGHLVVINAPRGRLPGPPSIVDGRVSVNGELLTGFDYLVLRVECRTERPDWRFPELDDLITAAGEAFLNGYEDVFQDRRRQAIVQAWCCRDLIAQDRKRVALLVAAEVDAVRELHAVPGPDRTLERVAPQRLVAADAPELAALRLTDLL